MRKKSKKLGSPVLKGTLMTVAIIAFCTLVGYTVGRFIEVATVQHVYLVSTPVTYMHNREKHQSEREYQATIASDQATISYLNSAFRNDNAKLKEFKKFSRKYNTQIDYKTFKNNVDVKSEMNRRNLIFIGKSSDLDVATNLSKSYAEDAIATIQKVSNTAAINVRISSRTSVYDTSVDHKFGVTFMLIGMVVGFVIGLRFWFQNQTCQRYYRIMMIKLNGE